MPVNKNVSRLGDHKLYKKRGVVATPLNDAIGDLLSLSSWTRERLPEYLWLGLVLLDYGRDEGFKRIHQIFREVSVSISALEYPKLSLILDLNDNEQAVIFAIIKKYIDRMILSPLTLLYNKENYPVFNEYFYEPSEFVEERLGYISEAIKVFSPPQSNETTDLKFLVLNFIFLKNKLVVTKDAKVSVNALSEYPNTNHDNDKMGTYRALIRSMEGAIHSFSSNTHKFSHKFWRDIGMITPCEPIKLEFDENSADIKAYIDELGKVIEYVFKLNKEKSLTEDKFDVVIGSATYVLKILQEIENNELGSCIVGRQALRTIIEIYIMTKYLLKKENDNPKIWGEYKLYGISKYKLILLKAREIDLDKKSHFVPPIAELIVNEIKSEEFIDVDLKYFDKMGIREKSIEVDEKDLYDLFYDYESSFSHGLWGAIRESSMIRCDNPVHLFHTIPDIYSDQKLPDIKNDCLQVIKKFSLILSKIFDLPDWFIKKYGIFK